MTYYEYLLSHDGLFPTLNYIRFNDEEYVIIIEPDFSNCGGYIP